MTKREYAEAIVAIIGGQVREVEKNNGVIFTGITITPEGKNIGATAYVDTYYDREIPVDVAAKEITDALTKANMRAAFDINSIMDWVQVKGNLTVRLYNKATNAEVKRSAGQYGFDGLIIVPVIMVDIDGDAGGSIKVTSRMLDEWKKSPKQVIDIALRNTKGNYEIKGMTELLLDMRGVPESEKEMLRIMMGNEEEKIYVITNSSRNYGAIGAILAQEELKKRFPNGYVILPSSVHEVICVPISDEINERELTQLVQEVNGTKVSPEERLADRAFYFAA